MKFKTLIREVGICGLSGFFSAFLLGKAGFYRGSLDWTFFPVCFFVGLGMLKFVTEVFNLISPVQAKQINLKELENKAIVAEAFNQSKSQH
jgi:hypothetical protein